MPWLTILIVLAVITLVGHGIWVLLAAICRETFSASRQPAVRCRHCGRSGAMKGGECQWCGRPQSPQADSEQADLAAVARQLRRWQDRGAAKPRTVERLLARVEAYRDALLAAPLPAGKATPAKPQSAEPLLAEVVKTPPRRATPLEPPRPRRPEPALPRVAAPAAPAPPPKPRRSLGQILSAFMEERNIRWGELVGGLLIVGSSVALVVSIWEQLQAIPYSQFFIFVAVSAALFGIGLYTEHRWKLTSTSHGVLIIATLLTPLNFVALVATRRPGFDPVALAAELAALAIFVALVYRAGRVLAPQWAAWLTLAVVGNSGTLLLLLDHHSPAWAVATASLATALEATCIGAALLSLRREKNLSADTAGRLFVLAGVAAFALAVVMGMVVVRSGDRLLAAQLLAPLLALAGIPIVVCGLKVMNGLSANAELAGLRTAGTAVALVGAAVMLAALGLAWPRPNSLVAVGLLNFTALAIIGLRYRLRPLHALAIACLAVSYMVACQLAAGRLTGKTAAETSTALLKSLVDGQTGLWLVGLFALLAVIAEVLTRRRRSPDAACYGWASAITAAASLGLVSQSVAATGGDHSARAAAVYAAYGFACLLINARLRRPLLAYLASWLAYIAALFAATAWLVEQPWVRHDPASLIARPSLQCYAAAWAALSLLWSLTRIGVRSWRPAIRSGASPQPLDRWLLRLVIAASLALAAWQALPGVRAELTGGGSVAAASAGLAQGAALGWLLLAAAGSALVAALWDRWQDDDAAAAVLLSINVAVAAAIPASAAWATASALRWALAGVFIVGAAMLWFRASLAKIGDRLGCRLHLTAAAPVIARNLWLALAALPVVAGSAAAAVMRILGQPPPGPLAGTWFAELGFEASHLAPLALVVLGLAAYAVRELSPGYAFVAGIVANLTVAGGYALMVPSFGAAEAARLLQLATITAALWSFGWLASRRLLLAKATREPARHAKPLLRAQTAESILGNMLLISTATIALFFASPELPAALHHWVAAVGSPLGWLALVVGIAAGIYRLRSFGERLRPNLVGVAGMAALSLAACSVEAAAPGAAWAYRALMLGWSLYALSVVAATWWAAAVYAPAGAEGPPAALVNASALWVRVAGLLALALGLKTVVFVGIRDVETLWAAGAIGIASAACAAMAVWLRREGWAFTAGLGVNLAASLAVCHRFALEHRSIGNEWIALWQANVLAGAVVALVWIAAWRRMYAGRSLAPAASPLLSFQVGCVAVAGMGLTAIPAIDLLISPEASEILLRRCSTSAGWFAWLLASAAAAAYLYHASRRAVVHVVAALMLGLGALATASVDPASAYLTLATSPIVAGAILLISGWFIDGRLAAAGRPNQRVGEWLRSVLPARELAPWIAVMPWLTAGIALRGALFDPQWALPLGGRLLAAAILPGGLAVWRQRRSHLYASGLLAQLAASLIWYARPEPLWADLIAINALAAALLAIFWTLWFRLLGSVEAPSGGDNALPPMEQAATALASLLVTAVAGWSWLAAANDQSLAANETLIYFAWSAALAACLVSLWDRRAAIGWPGVYAAGLTAIALALVAQGWRGEALPRITASAIAGLVCAAAIARQGAIPDSLRARLGLPPSREALNWFSPTQAVFAIASAAMGVWVALHFGLPSERWAAPLGAALLLAGSLLTARRADGAGQVRWRVAGLLLVALLPTELGWTWLGDDEPAIVWIHRQVILLASLAAVIACCELAASRWLAAASSWREPVRRFLPLAIGLALTLVGALLVQERIKYLGSAIRAVDGTRPGVPMALAAKLAMAAVLAELIGLALRYAVVGDRDPLRLSLRGRMAYVYAAELLVLAVFAHLRLTIPRLFLFGIIENWWTLVVMAVAFCGAGLSEFFRRRGLEVLSEPLRKTALAAPLLPVVALATYLVWRPNDIEEWIFRARLVSDEAVFFLAAAFYGLQAWMRRSLTLASFSAIAANAGFWLLWHRLHFDFLVHPQLWLIPPALAILVAEYLNRDRLPRSQGDALRYLSLAVIYVSSTADVFISHVGRDISLPLVLVLMGFSVSGILSGMLLQTRPFLYLGFTFLLVDLSVMVYHAAWDLGHTWVFWATGIAVGAAIIALFAVFEKRRNEAITEIGGRK